MAKIRLTLKIDENLRIKAEEIAKLDHRSLTNLIEKLLYDEVNRVFYENGSIRQIPKPEGGEVVGAGADDELKRQFEAFTLV